MQRTRHIPEDATAEDLWSILEGSTKELITANGSYQEWTNLRKAAMRLAGRFDREGKKEDEAWQPLLDIIAVSTRKLDAIEAFLASIREFHQIIDNRLKDMGN